MRDITIQEIDEIVLTERSSLENASLDDIEKRAIELEEAFILLQKNAKIIKQKQIVVLEEREKRLSKLDKSEVKQLKKEKKIDNTLDEIMAKLVAHKGSSVSGIEEKK